MSEAISRAMDPRPLRGLGMTIVGTNLGFFSTKELLYPFPQSLQKLKISVINNNNYIAKSIMPGLLFWRPANSKETQIQRYS